jgi:hypothetical protein
MGRFHLHVRLSGRFVNSPYRLVACPLCIVALAPAPCEPGIPLFSLEFRHWRSRCYRLDRGRRGAGFRLRRGRHARLAARAGGWHRAHWGAGRTLRRSGCDQSGHHDRGETGEGKFHAVTFPWLRGSRENRLYDVASPTLSAAWARRAPMGLAGPAVESALVCSSACALITAPNRVTKAERYSQVSITTTPPSEP